MKTREELLFDIQNEPTVFESFEEARNFALKMSNYYDLQNEIEHAFTKYYVIFTEIDNG